MGSFSVGTWGLVLLFVATSCQWPFADSSSETQAGGRTITVDAWPSVEDLGPGRYQRAVEVASGSVGQGAWTAYAVRGSDDEVSIEVPFDDSRLGTPANAFPLPVAAPGEIHASRSAYLEEPGVLTIMGTVDPRAATVNILTGDEVWQTVAVKRIQSDEPPRDVAVFVAVGPLVTADFVTIRALGADDREVAQAQLEVRVPR